MDKKNKFIQLWLIIGIIAGFVAVVFFIIRHLQDSVLCEIDCGQSRQVIFSLILVSLFGMFIGSLTFYFISDKYEKKIVKIKKDLSATYKFLDSDQRKILKSIIAAKGNTTQSEIVKTTGLSRVQISRCINQLISKEILSKSKEGMTNQITLSDDLKDVFLEEDK